jgi:hypothetical protein
MKLNSYWKAVLMSVGLVGLLAVMDILAFKSGLFKASYSGTVDPAWWHLYQSYGFILLITLPIFYYLCVKQDKSESLALFLNSWILWSFGLEDVLYYLFQAIPLDKTLPWLDNTPAIHFITNLMQQTTVTSISLLVSVGCGFIIIFYLSKLMLKVN